MSIKTSELQQLSSVLGTDSVVLDSGSAGTARLPLTALARYMDGELLKSGTALSMALSNKAEVLQASRTLYVSNSGSDSTGDGSEGKPFATIQRAINTLPKNLGGTRNTIHVAAGEYPEFEIQAFYGGSYQNKPGITIQGDENGRTVITGGVIISGCEVPIELRSLKVTGMNSFNNIVVLCSRDVDIGLCTCAGTTAINGIWAHRSIVKIYECEINDKTGIGLVADASVVFASLLKGTNNNICIQTGSNSSGRSSLIIGDRHEITGTTKYVKERGGIIFADGALA